MLSFLLMPNKKIISKIAIITLITIFFGIIFSSGVFASKKINYQEKKVILIAVNSITLDDLIMSNAPNIKELINSGAVGLMNSRSANAETLGSYYLTIGTSNRADAGEFGGLGFNAWEKLPENLYSGSLRAKDLSIQNNSISLPKESVINISINNANSESFKLHNNVVAGLLGEALKKAGRKTAVVGNADTLQEKHREMTLITMDLKGRTSFGDVYGDTNKVDNAFPGGIKTDYEKLTDKTIQFLGKADFIAVETGDTARLDYQRPLMSKVTNSQRRIKAIEEIDSFIGGLKSKLDLNKTLMIIASPKPQEDAIQDKDFLTPIIMSSSEKGLLTSETTKRGGIVTNLDLAPAILNYLDVRAPVEYSGNNLDVIAKNKTLSLLSDKHNHILTMRMLRIPIVVVYYILLLVGMILAVVMIRLKRSGKEIKKSSTTSLKLYLLFLLAVPLSSLFEIPFKEGNEILSVLGFVLLSALIAMAAYWGLKKKELGPLFIITALTSIVITIDVLTGTNLSQNSFLGSDLISGGRYYGVGNDYMGILLGASIFSIVSLSDLIRWKGKIATSSGFALLIVVSALIGLPQIGANVGGLITGVAAALTFLFFMSGQKKLTLKNAAIGLLIICVFVAGFIVINSVQYSASHAGKALALIESKGSPAVTDIIFRKFIMNVRGTLSFPGFVLMMMFLLAVTLNKILKKEDGIFGQFHNNYPAVVIGFLTMIWAATIGFLFNDTGALVAACIAGFLLVPLFYLSLN